MSYLTRNRVSKPKAKTTLVPKSFSLHTLFKKRVKNSRSQAIKSDLAARTLYIVDGDNIVVTSLERKPFCCQDELACMRRPELCRVARELNRKLPRTLSIEPLACMSEEAIRRRIEEMMGFRHFRHSHKQDTYKGRASDSNPNILVDLEFLLSNRSSKITRSPVSSLSSRSSQSSAPYGLDVVEESDEESGWYLS